MVTAIIPTLNEEKRIGEIISFLKTKSLVTEIIVIDDGSVDATFSIAKDLGAKVYLSTMLGKGASMADGLHRAQNDIVLYLDGDIYGFSSELVEQMVNPIIENKADFVKGKFQRQAGRVTMLTAKPMLKMFFPELASIDQPLGGIVAARKSFLEHISFETDYGVDIGLMIDIHFLGARIHESDIGSIEHDHQSLDSLSLMSTQIVRTILERASKYQKLNISHVRNSTEQERKFGFQFGSVLSKIKLNKNLALIDMDGTLIEGSFIHSLAQFTGITEDLKGLLGNHQLDAEYRTKMIAKILSGVPRSTFEKIANSIPLKPRAQKMVIDLKRKGFQVGIITDSYVIAAEIIRRRVFADFTMAHLLHFNNGRATGEISISPFMQLESGCTEHKICKSNFVEHLKIVTSGELPYILSIGNGENDICLFKSSHDSIAVFPQSIKVMRSAKAALASLDEIEEHTSKLSKTGS